MQDQRKRGQSQTQKQRATALLDLVEAWYSVQVPAVSINAAATRFGVSAAALYKRLHPQRATAYARQGNARRAVSKRQWDETHRAKCVNCGEPLQAGSSDAHGKRLARLTTGVCPKCISERAARLRAEMVRLREEEGLTNRQIAHQLNVPVYSVQCRLSEMRRAGVPVAKDPYMAGQRT